ncbi:MAG: glycosyltransferase family 4 protein [Planctomycetota bacterium]
MSVHFRGVVLGQSGFAAEGREWLAALEAAGLQPSLEGAQLGSRSTPLTTAEADLIRRCAARAPRAGAVAFHHLLIPHYAPDPRMAANVLSTVWEAEGLPPGWAATAARADVVLVHTAWNRDSFARAGVPKERLRVLAPPVDATPFAPPPRQPWRGDRPFRWLSMFDWSLRKGWDALLDGFAAAFRPGEAELRLKVHPGPGGLAEIHDQCRARLGDRVRVTIDDSVVPAAELPRLFAAADGFVLPSRGEGWGRPVQEAMLMALPTVATQAGALGTLLPNACVGYPVASRLARVTAAAAAETAWFRGLDWWEPDVQHLAVQLRLVLDDPERARQRGEAARDHALTLGPPDDTARALAGLVEELKARQAV